MTIPTPDAPSLLERAKAWFEKEVNAVKDFRDELDPQKGILAEAIALLHDVEQRVTALEAVVAKDTPVAEEAVKDAETVAQDAEKAAVDGEAPAAETPSA